MAAVKPAAPDPRIITRKWLFLSIRFLYHKFWVAETGDSAFIEECTANFYHKQNCPETGNTKIFAFSIGENL